MSTKKEKHEQLYIYIYDVVKNGNISALYLHNLWQLVIINNIDISSKEINNRAPLSIIIMYKIVKYF